MGDSLPKICEIDQRGEMVVCPFLIPDLEAKDYCGYYGRDLEGRRLGCCEVEEVLARKAGKEPLPGEGEK